MDARNTVDLYREGNEWFAQMKSGTSPKPEMEAHGQAPGEALRNLALALEQQTSGQAVAERAPGNGRGNPQDEAYLRDGLHWQPEDFGFPKP